MIKKNKLTTVAVAGVLAANSFNANNASAGNF